MSHKDVNQLVKSVIQKIAVGPDRGRDVSEQEAFEVMQAILDGHVDPVQTAVILIALRMKRESLEEFKGLFRALQLEVEPIQTSLDHVFCLADPFDGYLRYYSMTPFIPAVLAANGFASVMTGVEAVGPKFGVTAHQVYKAAGMNTDLTSCAAARCLESVAWTYLDQSVYAPKLFALRSLRQKIIKRSAVTTLERLMMPLRGQKATHLVLGYVHKAYPDIYSTIAERAGFSTALLVKGVEGGLAPAVNKPLRQVLSGFHGLESAKKRNIELPISIQDTKAASPAAENPPEAVEATLELGLRVLNGELGLARKSLVAAVSQILLTHLQTDSFGEVVEKVQRSLDNGSALEKFNSFRSL